MATKRVSANKLHSKAFEKKETKKMERKEKPMMERREKKAGVEMMGKMMPKGYKAGGKVKKGC